MNAKSIIHQLVSGLAGLGTYLATVTPVDPATVETINKAGEAAVDPIATLLAAVAMVATHWIISFFGNLFRLGAGEKREDGAGSAGGRASLFLLCLAVAGLLPGCAGMEDYPFTASISYRDPATGAKAGLSYSPEKKLEGAVTVPIYDAQTGELLGMTDVVIGDSAK